MKVVTIEKHGKLNEGRDGSVGIALGCGLDELGSRV
jgi:hypothetical protein